VLPFENWHSDEGFAHLGDAIANEINTQLSKINDFHVFAYTSCAKFKGPDKPSISEIGQELGANFIIEGSVERQNDNVSIHVQVIRADLDDHIWANEFRGKWKDIFSIRTEIAVSIANELETVLSTEEIKRIEKTPTENPEAYNLVLLGNHLVSKNSPISLREALNSYEYAISLDTNCTAAYVGLAQCYQFMIRYSLIERKEGNKRARKAVNKALELDETNGLAYAILGLIKISGYWDIYGPEADFQKAIRYSPNNAWVYASYAQYLRWLGKYDLAIDMAQKASSLDPLTPINNFWLGAILLFSGQYDESISYLLALKERFPDYAYIYSYLAYNYVFKGDSSKVIYYADRALSFEEYSQFPLNLSPLAWAYSKAGNTLKAKEILAEMETFCEQDKEICDPVSFAVVYTGLGEYEVAFQYLSEAIEIRSGMVPYLRVSADFTLKEISSDPRYIEILKEIGFRE
jgi:serine/threonine-protein kinase